MFNKFFSKKETKTSQLKTKTFYQNISQPIWFDRNYIQFSQEAYIKNVVANRCINMISSGGSYIKLLLKDIDTNETITHHPLLDLINKPNPLSNKYNFFETIFSQKLIAGNVFIQAIFKKDEIFQNPIELYILRPDRITILTNNTPIPYAYKYKINNFEKIFKVSQINGKSEILHIKSFNPTNDWYGLSQIEAAAYSIDQHNEASKWNQAMLQNGAKPSGALMVKNDSNEGFLSDEQFTRLKKQLDDEFSGSTNAGKPLLLEGGLEWKEMSLSPKDMDFLETKYSSARDIALAFGVPPQLLGIPGDNTYSNFLEARLFLWEQTILPLFENILDNLNNWLTPMFDEKLKLTYDMNSIVALSPRRNEFWQNINNANFLTNEEKKEILKDLIKIKFK